MAKNKIFKDLDLKNHVSRNGFDLSSNVKFTAKCGELLPIYHRTVMPGDSFKISLESFTRTSPMQTSAFTKIKEYFDIFFVPYRVLGKQIPHILAQDKDNPTQAVSATGNNIIGTSLPRIQLYSMRTSASGNGVLSAGRIGQKTNEFGYYRAFLSSKLLNHLGYCWQSSDSVKYFTGLDIDVPSDNITYYSTNNFVSLLPLASYQKIYYDYFRNTQWEDNVPYNYNFDYISSSGIFSVPGENLPYWNNPTLFDLRYANYPKDLFFGLIPDSQYGDTASVEVDGFTNTNSSANVVDNDLQIIDDSNIGSFAGDLKVNLENYTKTLKGQFDILEFRKARIVQRFREILGTGKKTYSSIIEKIFNVQIPETLSDECIYLGGHTQFINVNDVDNTNLTDPGSAIQRGKGLSNGNGSTIEFESKEYGHLMIIYHAIPEIDFALNAFHFDVTKISVDDYANPMFDTLGLQELPVIYLDNSNKNNTSETPFVGYTTRYFDYKTGMDYVLGDFRETLNNWVAPLTPDILFEYDGTNTSRPGIVLDYRFFKVNPSILNPIFTRDADSYLDTDQLRVSTRFSIQAVRNLDYLGIPTN